MNDPEVTMPNALTHIDLIAHKKALEAAGDAITLVLRVPSDRRRRGLPLTLPPSAVAAAVAGADRWRPEFQFVPCPSRRIPDEPKFESLNVGSADPIE
jgi:hypothetical protein